MERKKQPGRSRKVTIRFSEEEYNFLQKKYKETTCRKLSEYFRDVLKNKPVTVWYRNQSADDFLPVAILLKEELSSIGNNLNQLIKKLHQSGENMISKNQLEMMEACQFSLLQKVEEIKFKMNQIYQSWSQK